VEKQQQNEKLQGYNEDVMVNNNDDDEDYISIKNNTKF
jgi:hypothetical protein